MNTTSSEHETSSSEATFQLATKITRTFALCISILGLLGNGSTFKIISKYKDQTSGTFFIKALSVVNSIVTIWFGFLPIFSTLGLDLMTLNNYVCIPWIFFSALSGISGEWVQTRSLSEQAGSNPLVHSKNESFCDFLTLNRSGSWKFIFILLHHICQILLSH